MGASRACASRSVPSSGCRPRWPSMRRTVNRFTSFLSCWYPNRRPSSICRFCPNSRKCSATVNCVRRCPARPTRPPCTRSSLPGNRMLQTSVAQLYEAKYDKLALTWLSGRAGGDALIRQDPTESAAFVGHLNLIHPNRIQVLGKHEQAHLDALDATRLGSLIENCVAAHPAAILLAAGVPGHPLLRQAAESRNIALWASPEPAAVLIDNLRRHLSKVLAESTTRHGVFMDVLGLGVLITGDSG